MSFEKHIRFVYRVASQRLGILRKSWCVFHNRLLPDRCFWGIVLPVLGYCHAVGCSADDTHLNTLSYTAIIGIASLTAVAEMANARIMVFKNNYFTQLQIK